MKIDLLFELYHGKISSDEAYDIFDEAVGSHIVEFPEYLGFDPTEWTAICHAMSLGTVARWRYEGWPDVCTICGKKIDVPNYGWLATEEKGKAWLDHTTCIPLDPDWKDEEHDYVKHVIERISTWGITLDDVYAWVRDGESFKQTNGRYLYISERGAAIITKEGKLITAFPASSFNETICSILKNNIGK
jgi:hypothetical protein